eukprot:COSAG04_NODE_18679_length_435_cov_0.613095_2_plen_91_part_01
MVRPDHGQLYDTFQLVTPESSWSDDLEDYPLTCRFGYADPRRRADTYLTDRSVSFASSVLLPLAGTAPGFNYSAFVDASDVWGSVGRATAQ